MPDLVHEECGWYELSFDSNQEIEEYLEKTELIPTHFDNQDCPNCGEEQATQIMYKMCMECEEAEIDCMCDVETPDLSEEEAEAFREKVLDLFQEKMENQDMDKEEKRLAFKEKDLRRMASRLMTKHFESDNSQKSEADN